MSDPRRPTIFSWWAVWFETVSVKSNLNGGIFLYANIIGWLRIICLLLYSGLSWGHVSINQYDAQQQLLYINVVADHGNHQVYLERAGMLTELTPLEYIGAYLIVAPLRCDDVQGHPNLHYRVNGQVISSLRLEGISCLSPIAQAPTIIQDGSSCLIHPNGKSLWRVANKLSELNGFSVYQNVYAIFLSNHSAFIENDINKMKDTSLSCPSEQALRAIDKNHAVHLFQNMLKFNLTQSGSPIR